MSRLFGDGLFGDGIFGDTSVLVIPGNTATIDDLLDGHVGQVTEDVRFEILGPGWGIGERPIDILHPTAPGSVSWNPTNRITRTLSGVRLDPDEGSKMVAGQHWVRPMWDFPLTGDSYPLGVFLYMGGAEQDGPGGTWIDCAPLPDQSWQLDQKITDLVQVTSGTVLTEQFDQVAEAGGIPVGNITGLDSAQTMGTVPLTFLAGKDGRLDILTHLTDLLGYLPPYFDSSGALWRRPVPNPVDDDVNHRYYYGQNSRIIADTVTTSTRLAPNVYLAESTSTSGAAVSARYDVPADAPNSVFNIGFEIVAPVLELPGAATTDQAVLALQAQARRDAATAATYSFSSVPDPRHDAFGIIDLNGTLLLEIGWSLELAPGGKHSHQAVKAYSA